MKLFKSLIIAISLIASNSEAYERFKYEAQLTRYYCNPSIKPDPGMVSKIWMEAAAWTERWSHVIQTRTKTEREYLTLIVYVKRINAMLFETLSGWATVSFIEHSMNHYPAKEQSCKKK